MSAIASIVTIVAVILVVNNEIVLKTILLALIVISLLALFIWGLRKKSWRNQYLRSSIFIVFISIAAISLVLTITLPEKKFPWTLIYTVPISLTIWLTITMLTKPVEENKLIEFYRRVHPGGPGWKRIADQLSEDYSVGSLFTRRNIIGALFGIVAVLAALLGIGNFVIGHTLLGFLLTGAMLISVFMVVKNLSNEKWESANLESK